MTIVGHVSILLKDLLTWIGRGWRLKPRDNEENEPVELYLEVWAAQGVTCRTAASEIGKSHDLFKFRSVEWDTRTDGSRYCSNFIQFGRACDALPPSRNFDFGTLRIWPWQGQKYSAAGRKIILCWDSDHQTVPALEKIARYYRYLSAILKAAWRVTAELKEILQ